ncbi:MAG TPA: chromosome segregation protein SMC [Halanaerobiales bacterium]|nr:chromosome segregation protein SMC [Halanaerobiales bacterium]
MFLKKIKINGFKSFANPIIIDFQSPVTAIVGPNGSGKSNVVDAIRWALGEQSAKTLRGSRMSDIIFAGSEDYKPLQRASVTLYFDNTDRKLSVDSNEVRICRKVNEDGQSDYLLNGNVCRLKDIEEILMDTGMGKDAYSIVGQGKIDSILNSKPQKLRELFEEAAGISRYKMRKEEAEKRLDKTKHDLQRVKDLIWELDRQLTPIKKASEKARKYRRLKEEMGVLEINLFLDYWEKNNENIQSMQVKKEKLYNRIENLETELQNLDLSLKQKKEELEKEEEIIEELHDDYYQSRIKKEQAENNLKVLKERQQGLSREKKSLKQLLDELEEENNELLDQQERIDQRLDGVIKEDKEFSEKLARAQFQLNEQKDLLEKKRSELFSRRNSILNENVELQDLNTKLEKYREKGRYLELEIEKMVGKRKGVSSEIDDNVLEQEKLCKQINEISQEMEKARKKIATFTEKERDTTEKISAREQKIKKKNDQLLKYKSRLQVLKDMENDYQGYYRGVREIMKTDDEFPGIIGVVADLFNVEKEYELAIEIALGAAMQNIVVEDEKTARACVEFLKKHKAGRATFLPLDMITEKKLDVEKMGFNIREGILGIATDFVSSETRLTSVINNLLGRILLAKDLKSATAVARKLKSRLKIVTLDGEVINPGGSITGGSRTENGRRLLGRSREIEELQSNINILAKEISQKKECLLSIEKELKGVNTAKDESKYHLTNLEFQKNDLIKDLANYKKEQERLELELEKMDREFVKRHEELGEIDNHRQNLKQEIELANSDRTRGKDKVGDLEEELKEMEILEKEANRDIADLRVELATVKQKKENLLNEKNILHNQLKTNQEKMEKTAVKIKKFENKFVEMESREKELQEMKQNFVRKIEKSGEEYREKQKGFKEKEKGFTALQEKEHMFQEELNENRERHHKQELKITRMEDKTEQFYEKLVGYGVKPEEGIEERIEISNYTQTNRKIEEFRDAMESLEPVNEGAIQEYSDLKERLEYLENQQKDLLEARDSLVRIIRELEKTMGQMFKETFNMVRKEFERIFQELFDGGKARLELTETGDTLNTGIEIEAQPPGKQLKKLSLMSGGERALTAIALVFAFLQVNPSPIYILDEIDASLDDANVLRFALFIRKYSSSVQFLLVTHNKQMMTEADVIYGITMEEPGVSKLVSLRLDEEIA